MLHPVTAVVAVVALASTLLTPPDVSRWPGAAPTDARSLAPGPIWARGVPVKPSGFDVSRDGTIVVVGSTTTDYPGGLAVLWALSPRGSVAWRSSWAPKGGYARAAGVAIGGDRAYAVGVVSPEVACDWEIGSFGWFVVGTDERGRTEWARLAPHWDCRWETGGPIGAGGGSVAIATTRLIEGYSDVHGALRVYGTDGTLRWTDPFEPFPVGGSEGYDADDVMGLAVDGRGRVYAAGWAWRYPREWGADHEAALMAFDAHGHRRWVRVFGEPARPRDDIDLGTDVDARGRRVLFAALMDTREGRLARVVALGASGARRWTADVQGTEVRVALGPGRTSFVANMRLGALTVRKLDRHGQVAWAWHRDPNRALVDIAVWRDRLYVLTRDRLRAFPAT